MSEQATVEQPAMQPSRPVPRLLTQYRMQVVPTLMKEFGYTSPLQSPTVTKIAVNIGLGEALTNGRAVEAAVQDLTRITGQKPVVTRARRSIATFKLREGMPVGVKVTLRGHRMWHFLDRLINIAIPHQRDFRGLSPDSFDGRGNYTVGLTEQLIFPEISYDDIDAVRGLEVTIVTSASRDEEGRFLLDQFNMPFIRPGSN